MKLRFWCHPATARKYRATSISDNNQLLNRLLLLRFCSEPRCGVYLPGFRKKSNGKSFVAPNSYPGSLNENIRIVPQLERSNCLRRFVVSYVKYRAHERATCHDSRCKSRTPRVWVRSDGATKHADRLGS